MKRFSMSTVALSLLLLCCSSMVYAKDIIVDIAIEGNRYIETPALLPKIKSHKGEALSKRQVSRDVQKLFATGYFSDVHAEGERVDGGLKLIFVVVENPVIAKISIEGNKEISDKKLKPQIKMKPGFILSPRLERTASNSIRKAYLEKGFYQMAVVIKTKLLDDGRIDVVIEVNEGDVTHIKEIRFIGNAAFTDAELLEPLASRESNFGSWFTDRDVFNRQRFEADAQLLRQFYQDAGYLDARIESTRLMLSPNKDDFYLALSVYEGTKFTVSAIELQGDIVPSSEALLEKVTLKAGDVYSITKLRQSILALTEVVGDEGFAFVSVTPSFRRNIKNNTVGIVFDIEKGREVYVERVEISGHTKTKDYVMRRELRQNEGERYSASHVARSKERLTRLGYVKDVRVSTPTGSADDLVEMKLDVTEGKSGTFSAGMTYSQLNKIALTGKIEEQNLFGEGYRVNLSADVGGATNNYSANLIDPYFLAEDVSASVSIFRTQTDQVTLLKYTQDTQGASFTIGIALNEYARYSVGYSQSSTTIVGDLLDTSAALRSQEGTYSTGELTQALSFDTRNRITAPTKGGLYSASLGYAGLTGDRSFYEMNLSAQHYIPLSDFWTLRGSANTGLIKGYGGKVAPIYRRYSLGGFGSLRGYDFFGVSLRDPATLDVLGGEQKATASIDLIFPLPYMESAGFRGAFFADVGTVWGTTGIVTEDLNPKKVRGSYGLSIEWISPVGPITMTWAKAYNAQLNDSERGFEFALGRGF